jgi:hypothetical protein
MDVEKTIAEIEQLEEMFEAPDIRPLNASDISAANRRHDEMLAHSPWFRLWQQYGVCCRSWVRISSVLLWHEEAEELNEAVERLAADKRNLSREETLYARLDLFLMLLRFGAATAIAAAFFFLADLWKPAVR